MSSTDSTTLNARQSELAEALYQAYRNNFYGLENKPLTMADWEGVVTDDDTAYAVHARARPPQRAPARVRAMLHGQARPRCFHDARGAARQLHRRGGHGGA